MDWTSTKASALALIDEMVKAGCLTGEKAKEQREFVGVANSENEAEAIGFDLRTAIEESSADEKTKERLLKKLDELLG
jgi:hypothetical protein